MNPIANLPATQNLIRAQQSQGYNRQYFGGDEVDEVVLSNQDEQAKKKKMWTWIGIVGAVIAGLGIAAATRSTGHLWGKGEDSLFNYTKISRGEGDSAQKLATVASTSKSFTISGGNWKSIAVAVESASNSKNYDNIVMVGKEENFKKLKEAMDKTIADKIKFIAVDSREKLGNDLNDYKGERNFILTDYDVEGLQDETISAILREGDGSSGNQPAGADNQPPEGAGSPQGAQQEVQNANEHPQAGAGNQPTAPVTGNQPVVQNANAQGQGAQQVVQNATPQGQDAQQVVQDASAQDNQPPAGDQDATERLNNTL